MNFLYFLFKNDLILYNKIENNNGYYNIDKNYNSHFWPK